tara:strand:- start:972 stop:1073 length:102 start_codon:yes stop_codon:yes gene_type:complete
MGDGLVRQDQHLGMAEAGFHPKKETEIRTREDG